MTKEFFPQGKGTWIGRKVMLLERLILHKHQLFSKHIQCSWAHLGAGQRTVILHRTGVFERTLVCLQAIIPLLWKLRGPILIVCRPVPVLGCSRALFTDRFCG